MGDSIVVLFGKRAMLRSRKRRRKTEYKRKNVKNSGIHDAPGSERWLRIAVGL